MITKGFIQLNRDILNWQWYGDIYTARLFLHLLLTANYEECEWQGITVKTGQRVVSTQALSEETGIPKTTVHRILDKLLKSGEIERERNGLITIITLKKYNELLQYGTQTEREWNDNGTKTERERNENGTKMERERTQCNNIIKKENNNNNNKYNAFKNFNASSLDLELMEQTALAKYRSIPQD